MIGIKTGILAGGLEKKRQKVIVKKETSKTWQQGRYCKIKRKMKLRGTVYFYLIFFVSLIGMTKQTMKLWQEKWYVKTINSIAGIIIRIK